MVLICHDKDENVSRGGIILPDDATIPTMTGIIAEIPEKVKNDPDYPFNQLDRVIYDRRASVPIHLGPLNRQYLVPADKILGIIHEPNEDEECIGRGTSSDD